MLQDLKSKPDIRVWARALKKSMERSQDIRSEWLLLQKIQLIQREISCELGKPHEHNNNNNPLVVDIPSDD